MVGCSIAVLMCDHLSFIQITTSHLSYAIAGSALSYLMFLYKFPFILSAANQRRIIFLFSVSSYRLKAKLNCALSFAFKATNNVVEYEVLLVGL